MNNDEYKKGMEEESKEHKEFTMDVIKKLVRDHLKLDPGYYSKDEEEKEENEPTDNKDEKDEKDEMTKDKKKKILVIAISHLKK